MRSIAFSTGSKVTEAKWAEAVFIDLHLTRLTAANAYGDVLAADRNRGTLYCVLKNSDER